MARPRKAGLDYFPLDIDFFTDKKIKIVKARYGTDGITLYVYLLCEIYKNGYYLQLDEDFDYIISDDLNMNAEKTGQIINFLLGRSLFSDKLFKSDKVLTSEGIQRRFQLAVKERAKKNHVEVDRFWLLSNEETEPFIKVTHEDGYSKNEDSYSKNNPRNSQEESLKESKVKESIVNKDKEDQKTIGSHFDNKELNDIFLLYLDMRNNNDKKKLSQSQIQALKEELVTLTDTDIERIAIVKKAFASGWKSFYPLNKKQGKVISKNAFHNFEQRSYDFSDLEQRLLNKANNIGKE